MIMPTAEPLPLLGRLAVRKFPSVAQKKKRTSYVFGHARVFVPVRASHYSGVVQTRPARHRSRARMRTSWVTLQSTAMSQARSLAAARAVRPQAVRAR